MMAALSCTLAVMAGVGLSLLALQVYALRRQLREPPAVPSQRRPVSILKPLCGADDDLLTNLLAFVALDYPCYELLLGVRDVTDGAYPLARRLAERFPERVRVVVQRGLPGANPKVNQLVTLAAEARHDTWVVSDSNVTVAVDYLDEIVALLEDGQVGLVTHAIAGVGERRLGSLLDNLQLMGNIAPGVVGAKRFVALDFVVGKSMAMRRDDVARLGGFESVCDVLAEDFVIGRRVPRELGKRVALASRAVACVSRDRSLGDVLRRYRRWSVMQRFAVGNAVYAAQLVLHPVALALAAAAVHPSCATAGFAAFALVLRVIMDVRAGQALRPGGLSGLAMAMVPVRDAVALAAWAWGLVASTVEWRGKLYAVRPGTRLELLAHLPRAEVAPAGAGAQRARVA
jgi:ceramide glucosyltransferase